ncbi:MAG: hypothetical protein JRE71_16920 [Deltaproteobacteria bacterium]|nr:hypothetical protein [Deltaproteobacteria bacterium]
MSHTKKQGGVPIAAHVRIETTRRLEFGSVEIAHANGIDRPLTLTVP